MSDSCFHRAAIEVSGLTKRYQSSFVFPRLRRVENKSIEALSNVSLSVRFGQVYGLLGPNGAGKTLSLRLLTTAIAPRGAGTALVAGWGYSNRCPGSPSPDRFHFSTNGNPYRRLTPRKHCTSSEHSITCMKRDIKRRVGELSEQLDLATFIDRPNGTLSAGVRQRVSIARSLLHEAAGMDIG